MKVGIVADNERGQVWEKHLRPLNAIKEVVIAPSLSGIEGCDCCILIDDSENNLEYLAETIRLGMHTYLVSELPVRKQLLKQIHLLSQESDVRVQFSHWASLSPATQWMKSRLPRPGFIEILRESPLQTFRENRARLQRYWIDELAWIVKWMGVRVHRVEANEAVSPVPGSGVRICLQFENGASAGLFILAAGGQNTHRRIASGGRLLLDCEVQPQHVRLVELDENSRTQVQNKRFDSSGVAALSAMLFFKAVRLGNETSFTPFDALQTSILIERIESQLRVAGR